MGSKASGKENFERRQRRLARLLEMTKMHEAGVPVAEIAEKFGVSRQAVWNKLGGGRGRRRLP